MYMKKEEKGLHDLTTHLGLMQKKIPWIKYCVIIYSYVFKLLIIQ